ncbi:MAG: ABC-F family ATP-binding cassette domain-containing protein [Acetobacteraceae bacterium]|nr:ABC-F family ATP-binding cassette domain-containing protein [Acetobacteraceae bacterium]
MATISLRQVGFLASRPLFHDLTLTIGDADRLGVVAGNGAGKSTLLRCLAGDVVPTSGDITRSRGLRIARVEQDLPATLRDLTLAEAVRRAIPPADREAEGWRVDLVLDELDAPEALRDRPIHALSGGWQRLALIARAWVGEPDMLLLDEPTNHLDLEKIQRLEAWLNDPARRIPLVVASHDRQFLDTCTNRTLFLRPEGSRLYAHPYTRARALLADDDAAAEAKLERDQREAARLRRSAQELRNIGINSRSDAAQKKSSQMARRADRLEQTLRAVPIERSGDIKLSNRDTHAQVLLALQDVPVQVPGGDTLFRIAKLTVFRGDRIVLLGRNGVGKSLLVRLLHRAMTEPEGVAGVRVSPSVVVGYVGQQMSQLPAEASPLGFITDRFRLGDQRCRSLLAGAGFPIERQTQPIGRFSLGQRARLGLLALRLAEPNFYLMDEPTNHVDIAGQEVLESEIVERGATCVLVSHDRHFVSAVRTRVLLIERGAIREVEG